MSLDELQTADIGETGRTAVPAIYPACRRLSIRPALIGIAVAILLSAFIQQNASSFAFGTPWSFTRSVEVNKAGQDRGYYYRFKANYAYKGEPLDFNIVVGCNVSVTAYKDNSRSVEVGIAPMLYGLKMKDGRGVVIKPPEACQGQTTENGKVPPALLPLVVTYEDADHPWFGLAYASEDAYESSLSELKFFGATISQASLEEWQEWRKTEAPKNFITYELLGINEANRFDHPRWRPGYRVMSSICAGFAWVKLPQSVSEAIRPYWPASKPRYWYPSEEARKTFYSAGDFRGKKVLFEGYPLSDYTSAAEGILGVARHKPGGLVLHPKHVIGDIYPAASDLSLDRLDAAGNLPVEIKTKSKKNYAEATIDPKLKGFAYCDRVDAIDGVPSEATVLQPLANRINGEAISEDALTWHQAGFNYAFDRDEYVFFYKLYPLVSIAFGGL